MEHQIEIFSSSAGIEVNIVVKSDSVWATQKQMAEIFETTPQNITLHLKNVYKDGEIDENLTCKEYLQVQLEGKRKVQRLQLFYNLDAILSVGYRINSKRGTQFRQWATQRLKDYLVQGYAINEKRLQEAVGKFQDLNNAVKLAAKVRNSVALTTGEAKGILGVIEQYAYALETLDKYDHQILTIDSGISETKIQKLSYEEATYQIKVWRDFQNAGSLFGNEKDQSFKSSLDTIYQTFDSVDLYPSLEEKAANLLYFVVKNHSFSDGNKRIAAGLFIYFLDMNQKLYSDLGNKRIGDNALVAITIMIAESKSEEKDIMVKLVVNLINSNN
ncbi:MAG: virulence protein RhuM/Fic/DOC family protein [Bacteroidia bacterium]|nr:virulence protein RhuM/Fic/DOC family protein [Bacteroidia bacterium]